MIRKNTVSRIVMLLLPVCGIWPGRSIILIILIRMFWASAGIFIIFGHYYYFFMHLGFENFFDLIDCFCSSMAHAKVIMKLSVYWINQQKLLETIAIIRDDWKDCANSDIGLRVMMHKAKIADYLSKIILLLHSTSIIAYCSEALFADVDITETTEVPYLNHLKYPFNINRQRTYKFALIIEFLHMLVLNLTSGLVNIMLLTLVLHVGGQIEILQSWFSQLLSNEIKNKRESVQIATDKIIRKHQKIIQFAENIETIYTYVALYQFTVNTILICTLGFIIITALNTPDATKLIMKSVFFFVNTNIEAFIFCYAGEYLSNKSKVIGFATYNCPWYYLRPKDSRVLLFIILRSQKQLILTAGKMVELSLISFATIINASGSYLSILLAMQ